MRRHDSIDKPVIPSGQIRDAAPEAGLGRTARHDGPKIRDGIEKPDAAFLENAALRLKVYNLHIRDAATMGEVEKMLTLIEQRRQFIDTMPHLWAAASSALIDAMQDAIRDNADLLQGLEAEMELARARGKTTLQARRHYRTTQVTP